MAVPDTDVAPAGTWTCPSCRRAYPDEFTVCPLDATPRESKTSGDPQIGVILGKTYRITNVLGQGGMARLYEAEHLRIETHYAVKIIHDELAREPSLLARFEREARAAGKIKSQHVVQLVDVLRTPDDRPCIITELLEGEDLEVRLDRVAKLTVAEAIPIVRQICRGVAAAHDVGVVHRDLKPSNVFLCEDDIVKIFDFGIAKLDDDEKLTHTGAVMGTAAYMAPEQAKRAADAGPLCDVYSIGAILYHMLTGEPPYGELPAVSRFALLLTKEPARPRSLEPSIPEGIESVIQHAMARDTSSRIASVIELERQLAAFEGPSEAPVAASPRSASGHTGGQTIVPKRAQTDPTAEAIALRARLARPAAGFVATASSVAAGVWTAALLGALMSPTTHGERTLIGVIGLAALIGVAVLHVRTLRPIWDSTPAVSRYIAPFARALLGGVITFGSLSLAEFAWFSIAASSPYRASVPIVVAGLAATLGLGWRRWGLDTRLRRWIG